MDEIGVRAVIEGAAQYIAEAEGINRATSGIADSAEAAAQRATGAFSGFGDAIGGAGASMGETASVVDAAADGFGDAATAVSGLISASSSLVGPFEQVAQQGISVAQSAAQVASESHSVSTAMTVAAGAAAAVIAAYGTLALAGVQYADSLMRIADTTNLTEQQAALYSNALENVGGSGNSLIRTSFLLERQLVAASEALKAGDTPSTNVTRAMDALGISWHDATGEMKDMGELLPELFEKLGTMTDKQRAHNISTQLFGRFGVEVTRYLQHYSDVMPDAIKQTEDLTQSQKSASELAIAYHTSVTYLTGAFNTLGMRVLPGFVNIAERVAKAISAWSDAHGDDFAAGLSSAMTTLADAVGAVFTAIEAVPGPVWAAVTALGALAIGASVLHAGMVAVTASVEAFSLALLANPVTLAALAAAVTVATVAYNLHAEAAAAAAEGERRVQQAMRQSKDMTLEQIQAKHTNLFLDRDANVARLEAAKSQMLFNGALAVSSSEVGKLSQEIEAQSKELEYWNRLINTMEQKEQDAADAARKAADAQHALIPALTGAHGAIVSLGLGFVTATGEMEKMSKGAQALANDIQNVSAASLATKIVLEEMAATGLDWETIMGTPELAGNVARQIERAGKTLDSVLDIQEAIEKTQTRVTHGAGRTTGADDAAARVAQQAAEQATAAIVKYWRDMAEETDRINKKMADDAVRESERMVREVADVKKRQQEQDISDLDAFGSLLVEALRKQASDALDVQMEALAVARAANETASNAQIATVERQRDASIKATGDARDAQVAAIDVVTRATVAGYEAQIAALRDAASAEDRLSLVRNVALAYDPEERAKAERALRDFDRRVQENSLRDQITATEQAADVQKRAVEDEATRKIEAWKVVAAAQIEEIKADEERVKRSLDSQEKMTRASYAKQTEAFALESEARRLIMAGEQAAMIKLVTDYAPAWEAAGKSIGARWYAGFKSSAGYLEGLLTAAPGASGVSARDLNRQSSGNSLNDTLVAAMAGGAPKIAIDQIAWNIVAGGQVPNVPSGAPAVPGTPTSTAGSGAFAPGIAIGAVPQALGGAGRSGGAQFHRGAFENMLNGATFSGTPEENAQAIMRVVESALDDQMGRGRFVWGQ